MLKLKDESKENYGTLDVDNNSTDGMEEVDIKEMDKAIIIFEFFCLKLCGREI